jgi:DEP domain-containing protein 5
MPVSTSTARTNRAQKVCTLWTHDENFSREDVVFNSERFPELQIPPGSLAKIIALKQSTAVRDFQNAPRDSSADTAQKISRPDGGRRPSLATIAGRKGRRNSVSIFDDSGLLLLDQREVDKDMQYIFVCKPAAAELKAKHPNLQVSRRIMFLILLSLTFHCRYQFLRR